jgi:hypothetical protein
VEPIAARATADPEATEKMHDRLLHFVRESPWDDRPVRREAARYVVEALSQREGDPLLRRTFEVDVTVCGRCGGRLRIAEVVSAATASGERSTREIRLARDRVTARARDPTGRVDTESNIRHQ